jgi:kumamolisin
MAYDANVLDGTSCAMYVKQFALNVLFAAILASTIAQAAPSRFDSSIKPFTPKTRILGTPSPTEVVEFQIALKMRDFEGLQKRIATGEVISQQELAQKYYPLASDYQTLVDWAKAQGLTVQKTFENHLTLNLSGSVAQLRSAMDVDFARIDYEGKPALSAKTAPSLPGQFASFVLGVNGLQPLSMVPLFRNLRAVPDSTTTPFAIPFS